MATLLIPLFLVTGAKKLRASSTTQHNNNNRRSRKTKTESLKSNSPWSSTLQETVTIGTRELRSYAGGASPSSLSCPDTSRSNCELVFSSVSLCCRDRMRTGFTGDVSAADALESDEYREPMRSSCERKPECSSEGLPAVRRK